MKNLSTHYGTLTILERLPNSLNGNPRFLAAALDKGTGFTFRTAPDSHIAYKLSNYEGKQVQVVIGTYYGKTTLHSIKEV